MAIKPTQIQVLMRADSKDDNFFRATSPKSTTSSSTANTTNSIQPKLLQVEPANGCETINQPIPPATFLRARSVCPTLSKDAVSVFDFLFVGNLRSAYNDRLLCRLGIQCVVDVSGLDPRDVPTNLKTLSQCSPGFCCTSHVRPKLRVQIAVVASPTGDGTEPNNRNGLTLDATTLNDINEFIESARRSGRRVMVHDDDVGGGGGTSWMAPAVVVQYLTSSYGMRTIQALGVVRKVWPMAVDISPGLMDIMHRGEQNHRDRREASGARGRGRRCRSAPWVSGGEVGGVVPFHAWR